MSRRLKIAIQVAVSAGIIGYLAWRIDAGKTVDLIAASDPVLLAGALALYVASMWPMAWRWQVLLASKGLHEPLEWLTKLHFVGYAASQVLPTAIGGDAVRIVDHVRRRPDAKGEAAGAVLMERAVGSVGTLALAALGLAIAVGRYDVGPLVWVEAACVLAVAIAGFVLFSPRANALLQERVFPLAARVRLDRALTSVWSALHGYRSQPAALGLALAATVGVQLVRIVAMWMCGEAVGLDLSPLVYLILGPLVFLVVMLPIAINGLGVREAFFVAFLARFDVGVDAAFATAFLFYAVTVATALPGAFILLVRSVRPAPA